MDPTPRGWGPYNQDAFSPRGGCAHPWHPRHVLTTRSHSAAGSRRGARNTVAWDPLAGCIGMGIQPPRFNFWPPVCATPAPPGGPEERHAER